MNVVELERISLVRDGTKILDDVSWRIERGSHAALLGANGSGKTTLLKVLTGYEWPTSGSVRVLGRTYGDCDLRAMRKAIGWVSSAIEHRVPPADAAERIVASGFDASFGLYRDPTPSEWERCRAALDDVGVRYVARRPFGLLSQGEQKRVLIARALVHSPVLLVLDEPCAGLDPVSRAEFLDDVGRLAADPAGPTIVLVTHHLEEIAPWIKNIVALRAGKRVASGPVQQVLADGVLGQVFDRPCRVRCEHGMYRLILDP